MEELLKLSIREGVTYLLSVPVIKEVLLQWFAYESTLDRMIDALTLMIKNTGENDQFNFPLSNDYEKAAVPQVLSDMEHIKIDAFKRIVETPIVAMKAYKPGDRDRIQVKMIIICKELIASDLFRDYLIHRQLPRIKRGPTQMSREEELHRVICLFMWINYDVGWCDAYYFIKARNRFLETYKEYIRLDDTGSIRLSFDCQEGGNLVLGGEHGIVGMKYIETLQILEKEYPVERNPLDFCFECGKNVHRVPPKEVVSDKSTTFCSTYCRNDYYYPGEYH